TSRTTGGFSGVWDLSRYVCRLHPERPSDSSDGRLAGAAGDGSPCAGSPRTSFPLHGALHAGLDFPPRLFNDHCLPLLWNEECKVFGPSVRTTDLHHNRSVRDDLLLVLRFDQSTVSDDIGRRTPPLVQRLGNLQASQRNLF